MQTVSMAMHELIAEARSRHATLGPVDGCLAVPGTAEIPPAFNRLAHVDFAVLSEADPDVEWDDYCPAYALGFLTYEACCRDARGISPEELRGRWCQLRGTSRLAWDKVCAIIARSWNELASMERAGRL
jgi:hypothetical protein